MIMDWLAPLLAWTGLPIGAFLLLVLIIVVIWRS